jgi:preprotein translocase subunit YajC
MFSMLKLLFISSQSFAQAAAAPQANPVMQFLPLVLVFVIFYFLMLRPQKKKFEEEQAMLSKLQKGDEIYTKSGMIGTIYGMTDKIITLEASEGVKIKVLRSQVGGLLTQVLDESKK